MRSGAALIDIRSDSQIARDGTVTGALVIARNVLEWRLDPVSQHRHPEAPRLADHVILLCDEGYQSSLAAATRRGWLQAGPPGVDDYVVGDAGVDGVMQAEADDTVIVRVERPGGVFA